MNSYKFTVLLLVLTPLFTFAAEQEKVSVVTGMSMAASCISSVHVNNIDGREVKVPELGFDVEPGAHTITGRALIDTSYCKAMGIGSQRHNVQPLEAEFEAGKTYYLGYDHNSSNRNDWKLVIWKVEDSDS